MNDMTVRPATALDYSNRQLSLIKRTIASDCNEAEFDLFIEAARHMGLDPFRRQIMPLVFSKGDKDKRRMSLIVGIDGFRVIAARCADYRPDENEADIAYDPDAKSDSNPLGIVKATVTAWKQDRNGNWNPVRGVAYWDEFVPLKEESDGGYDWIETGEVWPDSGKPKKKKVPKNGATVRRVPDGNWGRMPRVMIAKCAEAQALRRGWPEHFGGVYDRAELDRAVMADVTASEAVEIENQERRMKAIGGHATLIVDWLDGKELARVPTGQFADRVFAFIRENQDQPSAIFQFQERNRETMREFWAKHPGDALEVKRAFENAAAAIRAEAETIEGAPA